MRYLMLIYGDEAAGAAMNQAGQAANMDQWMSYTDDFQKSGKMLGGEALMPTGTADLRARCAAPGPMLTLLWAIDPPVMLTRPEPMRS